MDGFYEILKAFTLNLWARKHLSFLGRYWKMNATYSVIQFDNQFIFAPKVVLFRWLQTELILEDNLLRYSMPEPNNKKKNPLLSKE